MPLAYVNVQRTPKTVLSDSPLKVYQKISTLFGKPSTGWLAGWSSAFTRPDGHDRDSNRVTHATFRSMD